MHIHKLISSLIPVETDGYIITCILVCCHGKKNIHNILQFQRKKRFFMLNIQSKFYINKTTEVMLLFNKTTN